MSDKPETSDTTETATSEPLTPEQLPTDHPLVKTLAEQKKLIRELKGKASRLDEIEDAQKTEAEKTAERIKQLEAEVETTRLGATRFQIAAEFGLNEKQSAAIAHASSEAGMRELAEAFQVNSDTRKKQGNHVPREGNNPKPGDDDMRVFARSLFNAGD